MILWIDPGVRKLGYAIIDGERNIIDSWILLLDKKSPTRMDQFERMKEIEAYFVKLCKKHTIQTMSMEKLFFTKFNQNNAEFVFGIRAILITLCLKHHIAIQEFTPIEVKKFVTGNGKAEKKLVQQCVMKLYGLKECPEFNDAADALALAYIASKIR